MSESISERQDFDFNGESVPKAYDSILVPVVFEPWAEMLLQRLPPQPEWFVLDLATGTGIVAHQLAEKLGRTGSIIGHRCGSRNVGHSETALSESLRYREFHRKSCVSTRVC